MLRRRITHRRLRFRVQTRKKLRRHHLRCALNHSLAHAGDCSTYLYVARIIDFRDVLFLLEIEVTGAFQKTRGAFTFDDDPEVLGLSQLFKANLAVKHSLDRTDTGLNSRRERILAGSFQTFATWNAPLQDLGINQRLINAFSSCFELVSAFKFQWTLAFAA